MNRVKKGEGFASYRFLLLEDNMGFTLTETRSEAGLDMVIKYKNHLEACYCIEGEGSVEVLETGEVFAIGPGVVYALDKHERHRLKITKAMRVICVFNPALVGTEIHDSDGSYPLPDWSKLAT